MAQQRSLAVRSSDILSGVSSGDSNTTIKRRLENRTNTQANAIVSTTNLGGLAQRGAALLHQHGFDRQHDLVNHAIDAVYSEPDARKQQYLMGIADQAINGLNEDIQAITDDAVGRIRASLRQGGMPPADDRPWWQQALKALPDE